MKKFEIRRALNFKEKEHQKQNYARLLADLAMQRLLYDTKIIGKIVCKTYN